jgi:hypothetical protein
MADDVTVVIGLAFCYGSVEEEKIQTGFIV